MAEANSSDKLVADMTEDEIRAMASFGPGISDEQVELWEKSASARERGEQRRLCLIACSRSADDLAGLRIESSDAFDEMLACIEEFKKHAKDLVELSESAYLRMLLADCRATDKAA